MNDTVAMHRPRFGYTLSSEEHGPRSLWEAAVRAEELEFDFVSISDHFHPWVAEQGHSPFVWSVLGAVAARTERIGVGIGVTCPIVRVHPAIVAHAAATTAQLFDDRFFLGVGTGEALNEHVLGHRWPPADTRLAMLEEAIDVMRRLWSGDVVDHHGRFYDVENAKLFDAPEAPLPVIVSGFGAEATSLAARVADGYWGHSPDPELPTRYRSLGGGGPMVAQLTLCIADDEEQARRTMRRGWPNAGLEGQVSQDLPTWTHFEQVTAVLNEDQVVGATPCGPDIEPVLTSVRAFLDAGYDHIYFHQVGSDQEAFFRVWEHELGDAVRSLTLETVGQG